MNYKRKLFLGFLCVLIIILIVFIVLFIKIRPFSICTELTSCEIDEVNYINWFPDSQLTFLLDSLTLYEHKNVDNGYDDYFYYTDGHIYCIDDSASLKLKDAGTWDEKIDKSFLYYYIPVADDSYLIRIRKVLGFFYLVELFEDFPDATFEAVVNRGCRMAPLARPLSEMKKGD